jgi:hypothetical protein
VAPFRLPQQYRDEALSDLNHRFREHGVGYQFESGRIIRVDSEIIHAEIVRPLLCAMNKPLFAPALAEFQCAHEHYRYQRNKECLNECLKSFESTMKAICEQKGWEIDSKVTANTLIGILFEKSFLPRYLDNQFACIKQLLSSGTNTIRNREGGHGQGTTFTEVHETLASYCLHLTATNLLFLIKLL